MSEFRLFPQAFDRVPLLSLTDSNVDLTKGNLVGNLVNGGQTGGALPVEGVYSSAAGEASPESGHSGHSGTSTGRQNVADGNVLYRRVRRKDGSA